MAPWAAMGGLVHEGLPLLAGNQCSHGVGPHTALQGTSHVVDLGTKPVIDWRAVGIQPVGVSYPEVDP